LTRPFIFTKTIKIKPYQGSIKMTINANEITDIRVIFNIAATTEEIQKKLDTYKEVIKNLLELETSPKITYEGITTSGHSVTGNNRAIFTLKADKVKNEHIKTFIDKEYEKRKFGYQKSNVSYPDHKTTELIIELGYDKNPF
jgi:hypothetical protein